MSKKMFDNQNFRKILNLAFKSGKYVEIMADAGLNFVKGRRIGLISEFDIQKISSSPKYLEAEIQFENGCKYHINEKDDIHYLQSPNDYVNDLGRVLDNWNSSGIRQGIFTLDDLNKYDFSIKPEYDGSASKENHSGSVFTAFTFLKDLHTVEKIYALENKIFIMNKNPLIYIGHGTEAAKKLLGEEQDKLVK